MLTINPEAILELKELDDDGSNSALKALVSMYLANTPSRLKALTDAFEQSDFQAMKILAHSIRSSSMSLGAEKFGQLVHDLEYAKEGPELAQVMQEIMKKITIEFELVKTELEKILANS